MRRLLPWLAPAAAVAAFWPTLGFPYLRWLDAPSIVHNQNLAFGWEELKWMWTSSAAGQWQPLTWLSLALDRALFGAGPRGTRAVNLALHALNAGLVFALARELLRPRAEDRDWAALAAALLWALHPLRAETLGLAALRRDLLGAALGLAACLLRARGGRRAPLALAAAAMLAHPWGAVLPGLFLLIDPPGDPARRRETLYLLPASLACVLLGVGAQAESGSYHALAAFPFSSRLAQAVHAPPFYALATLWPVGLTPHYERSSLLEPRLFALSLVACAAAAGLAAALARRAPGVWRLAAAYALLLVPVLGFVKVGRALAADRWSYLPAVPLTIGLAALLFRLPSPAARGTALAAAAAAALALRAHLPVYSSEAALWARARAVSPELPYPAALAADEAKVNGRLDEYQRLSDLSLRLKRELAERVARVYDARGERETAELTRVRSLAP